jgi:TfoX/Sxy family transcriptional regulator of competence genes
MTGGEDLADAVRHALEGLGSGKTREVRMFGGIGFMLNGNLLVGASDRGLLVRVGKNSQHEALERPGARPMIMRGRTMEGYVYVDPPELTLRAVKSWVQMAVSFVSTLPAKASAAKRPTAKSARPKTKSARS